MTTVRNTINTFGSSGSVISFVARSSYDQPDGPIAREVAPPRVPRAHGGCGARGRTARAEEARGGSRGPALRQGAADPPRPARRGSRRTPQDGPHAAGSRKGMK